MERLCSISIILHTKTITSSRFLVFWGTGTVPLLRRCAYNGNGYDNLTTSINKAYWGVIYILNGRVILKIALPRPAEINDVHGGGRARTISRWRNRRICSGNSDGLGMDNWPDVASSRWYLSDLSQREGQH